jgi:hypothetical protein
MQEQNQLALLVSRIILIGMMVVIGGIIFFSAPDSNASAQVRMAQGSSNGVPRPNSVTLHLSLTYYSGVLNAAVYDLTRGHSYTYTYGGSSFFVPASSMKVPIMLTFFDMIERQGRAPHLPRVVLAEDDDREF